MSLKSGPALRPAHKPVLIVDDSDEMRDALVALLTEEGIATATATHGAHALALLEEGLKPGLILLDFHMPVMDGLTFRYRQMANPRIADIPVILYSGAYDIRHHAQPLNLAYVFQKPIDLKMLIEVVRGYC